MNQQILKMLWYILDNIYFAKAAIKIGKENLKRNLDNIGFNEKIEFAQEIAQSTYGKIDSEPTLANSGIWPKRNNGKSNTHGKHIFSICKWWRHGKAIYNIR